MEIVVGCLVVETILLQISTENFSSQVIYEIFNILFLIKAKTNKAGLEEERYK